MKRFFLTIFSLAVLVSCLNTDIDNPYVDSLCKVNLAISFPAGSSPVSVEGIPVLVEDMLNTYTYSAATDASGEVVINLPQGLYRFRASYIDGADIYNGTLETTRVNVSEMNLNIGMLYSTLGPIVFKEIYCGGCKYYSKEDGSFLGNYQADKYVILHNNTDSTYFLDSLCFATLAPYNSTANSTLLSAKTVSGMPYLDVFAPVIQSLWQFPGDGSTFPLKAGEDVVIAVNGAIDHTVTYAESVNLNKEDYFVCYNQTYFPNEKYHPAPGDKIKDDHILLAPVKLGQANAYTMSVTSPASVIFKAKGQTIQEYINAKSVAGKDDSIITLPGSSTDRILNVPWSWVLDAVEVFAGGANGTKRINVATDAGYVVLTDTYLGNTLMRKTDEAASLAAGREILVDTNNSSNDFYERHPQSLHE